MPDESDPPPAPFADEAAADASPLILLARVDRLDLLRHTAPLLVVTDIVLGEVTHARSDPRIAQFVHGTGWVRIEATSPLPPGTCRKLIDAGEASVLSWCVANPGTAALLDDRAGRRCAESLNLPVRGTLGVVLAAKRSGAIPAARPIVNALRAAGMLVSDAVVEGGLSLVGE